MDLEMDPVSTDLVERMISSLSSAAYSRGPARNAVYQFRENLLAQERAVPFIITSMFV